MSPKKQRCRPPSQQREHEIQWGVTGGRHVERGIV